MTHLYHPSPEDIERVRQHVSMNSGFTSSGQPKPGRRSRTVLYPSGITSFAREIGLTRVAVSRVLSGYRTTRRTWLLIESQVNVHEDETGLIEQLAKLRGVSPGVLRNAINRVA